MRVLLLTSSTGGGHDMRASAFEAWAKTPDCARFGIETARLQVLESAHGLYRFGVSLYNLIQRRAPWLHHLYFSYLEEAAMHARADALLGRERFVQTLEQERPDVVLSTHAHLNHAYFELARRILGRRNVRCVTYCGELFGGYGFSRHWVNPAADLFIGAMPETCDAAARLGMPEKANRVGGFLLKPPFYAPLVDTSERMDFFRETLKLEPGRFTLILATGANGANNHLACLDAMHARGLPLQVVAMCGRDEQARKLVQGWAQEHPELPVSALAYTTDMHRIMDCADAIFARPGTGTTSEAILRGCPIIFNGMGAVMPQEGITVKFARKHGFAAVVSRAASLPDKVAFLMEPVRLQGVRAAMRRIRPSGTPERLCALLTELF